MFNFLVTGDYKIHLQNKDFAETRGGLHGVYHPVTTLQEGNFEVLSQTTWCEKICLFLGSFLALLQGASAPLIAMFTGRAVNVLTTSGPGLGEPGKRKRGGKEAHSMGVSENVVYP